MAHYAVPVPLERRSTGRNGALCIDCRHAADDCRRRRIPGTAGLPGALRGSLRRAGPGTGAVRRRSRPPRRHQRRPGLVRGAAAARRRGSRGPGHHVPGRGADRHGHGVCRDPPRRDSRPHRRRAGGPGPGTPGPGNHGGRRHLLRAAVHPPHAGARRPDAAPLPGRVAAELHEPGRHGHRSPGPGARPQGGRHLRFGQRAGAPGGARRRRRAARGHGSTAWATTG